ncbi:phage integrase N-terminal domain-containing protein [Pelobacter propionicus]|uniref:phage integrase N-terminal domain-containing protein n=1 Tax=Pelobacter propionicus TaxID=29543 RepID=UPI0022B5D19D|nr:phage integrase N-terminal domain-containing protein [Pelobacter propionicus]
MGKDWSVGKGTREAKLQTIQRFAEFVQQKFGLERIENLKPGHVQAYADNLREQNISARTGANYMAYVRDLCQAIGKGGIVAKDNATYGFGGVPRQNPLNVNHDKIADIQLQLDEKAANGDRISMMMSASAVMRDAFGLRQEEALLTPAKVTVRDGKQYLQVLGAKGGRPRELEIRTQAQRSALARVAETAKVLSNANGRPIPPEYNLKDAMKAESKEWHRLGGTRAVKANMHAQRRLAEGATKTQINRELGHGNHRSLGSYAKS